ncbi:hypothetical protein [uncultured Megasphaera sp.]|uniref:hypothetical protein n=1 Tax=uncultured Megasphaera sp. TaxID=165188 RepID=UPI00267031E8|nr:hypothetical protein [uncultured Megasphaera sp.]
MNEIDMKLRKRFSDFLNDIDSMNLNCVICVRSKQGPERFLMAANVAPEEAMCTLGNAMPLLFHPEWPGLPWDTHSLELVKAMAKGLMEQVDLLVSEMMICFSLAGDASRGGYLVHTGGMVEALDCINEITVQMTSALKKQISQ